MSRSRTASRASVIDDIVSFNQHFDSVCRSSYFHIRALRHIRRWITEEAANSIACATVAERLNYCNSLLFGTSAANLLKLQRVKKSLPQVVIRSPRRDYITPVLAKLHWLPIKYRIQCKPAPTVYKVLTTQQPLYLHKLIRSHVPARQMHSRGSNILLEDRVRLQFIKRAFRHAAFVWNRLPQSVISDLSVSLATFKSRLKTVFYSQAFLF